MAKETAKNCAVCRQLFTALEPAIAACSRHCALTLEARITRGAKLQLTKSEFAAKLEREESAIWRLRLRQFRLEHNLRLREMAFLLCASSGSAAYMADLEHGRKVMTRPRRMVLQALIDGYRPSNWPKGRRKPFPQKYPIDLRETC